LGIFLLTSLFLERQFLCPAAKMNWQQKNNSYGVGICCMVICRMK